MTDSLLALTIVLKNDYFPFPVAPAYRGDWGGVAERSMAADCKSADVRLRWFKSNPLHHLPRREIVAVRRAEFGGCSSMVEPQPSKLVVWVRFPSPAPFLSGVLSLAV